MQFVLLDRQIKGIFVGIVKGGFLASFFFVFAAGRLETRTWARGLRTRYYYNLAGSLTNVHYFTNGASDNGNPDPAQNPGNDPLTDDLAFEYAGLGRGTKALRGQVWRVR